MFVRAYWYALQVKAGHEIELAEWLQLVVDAAFCPTYTVRKKPSRHARKSQEQELPLFPKWLFVRQDNHNWEPILKPREVEGLLCIGGSDPLPIREREILVLKNECSIGAYNDYGISGKIRKGDKVLINGTHWAAGMSGVFQELGKNHEAVLELSLFGRLTRVEIPTGLIERML